MALYLGRKIIANIQKLLSWGDIQGSLTNQTDLKNALDAKADKTTTINSKPLSANITLSSSDVGALADSTKYAANLSYQNDTLQMKDQDGNNIGSSVIITSGGTITIDQTYDPTSANAQSGVAIAGAGFLTSITSTDVTSALGFTPYNGTTNPNGYTSNIGTVTSVNNVSPDASGNVTLSIPSEVTETTVTNWGFTKNEGTVTSVNSVSPVSGAITLTASNVGALADSTKYGADLSYSSNQLQLKDQDGNNLGSAITITSGGGTWGSITGTLSDQTDLQTALNAKSTVTFRDWS